MNDVEIIDAQPLDLDDEGMREIFNAASFVAFHAGAVLQWYDENPEAERPEGLEELMLAHEHHQRVTRAVMYGDRREAH